MPFTKLKNESIDVTNVIAAAQVARELGDYLIASYWARHERDQLVEFAEDELKKLSKLMGYRLEKIR